MIVRARDLSVQYRGQSRPALAHANLELGAGELVAVVGPNGCGKTTMLRALLGTVPIREGAVTLGDKPLEQWSRVELARLVGLVPQREESPFSWRVEEMVQFGRYVWRGPLSPLSAEDHRAVGNAIARCDLESFRDRRVETLSGGEWQRVRVARALAQEARVLFLDEPTASLDLGHEMELLELVSRLVEGGLAALVVTHQLNLAARFAHRVLLLSAGQVMASGTPEEVMRAELLSRVFRWPVAVGVSPEGRPQVVPLRDYS